MDDRFLIRPRLIGKRFKDGALPLTLMSNLAALKNMLDLIAKQAYLSEHPESSRVPRGFLRSVELNLIGLEKGSAIPLIELTPTDYHPQRIPPSETLRYFRVAFGTILEVIETASIDYSNLTDNTIPELLPHFKKLGQGLGEYDSLEFTSDDHQRPVSLSQQSLRRLVDHLTSMRVADHVVVRGTVPALNQASGTFSLNSDSGTRVSAPLRKEFISQVMEALGQYDNHVRIAVNGEGIYRNEKLVRMKSVQSIAVLDPLDLTDQLRDLRTLDDGWFDGEGLAPSDEGLDWLTISFEQHFSEWLPKPYLYPTYNGEVRAEWSLGSDAIVLVIDADARTGDWLWFDEDDEDAEESRMLNLRERADWDWLTTEIRSKASN